ncbi:MAG: ABC transporter ATP-binding protein [Lachnospiraceae bacterium]|nr:ABC transporter ATP-binding protein [Lachnospiraceae bacterium]
MLEFKNADIRVGRTPILQGISATFEKGRITALVGLNGSGKTTLLQSLNGLSSVTDGQIFLDGEDYLALAPGERAKRLSFFSQLRGSAPNISVRGLVEHGRFPYMGFSRKRSPEDLDAMEKAIDFTGLSQEADRLVSELSGGMQQRAYLAMQIAQECPYMVMDEPQNFLDLPGQRELLLLIRALKEEGKTVILVIHDLEKALRIADRIVVMDRRRIAGSGTPGECLESGLLQKVFDCRIHPAETEEGIRYLID